MSNDKPKRNLRVAVIGTGYFSRFHYAAWQRMPEVELVAMHAMDASVGAVIAAEFGVASIHDDVATMLDETQPDLVDIVTPPESHQELLALCIARAIPAICQKPFCVDLNEATRVVEEIESHGALVVIHENVRHQPWYRQISILLQQGLIGEPYEIAFDIRPGDGQGADAYLARQPYFQQQPRFLIRETAVHWIDVFRYLFGDITGLFARLAKLNPVIAGEDAGVVLFEFASGARGVLNGNRLADHVADNRRLTMGEMRIEGSAGSLALNGNGQVHFRSHGENHWTEQSFDWNDIDFGGDCVYATNRHVVDHLLNDGPLFNLAADYLVNRRIETAIYESHESQCWIDIAPAD